MARPSIPLARLTHTESVLCGTLYGASLPSPRAFSSLLADHLERYDLRARGNTHLFMRHGEAENNLHGICFAHPEAARWSCDLTEQGRSQVRDSVLALTDNRLLTQDTLIISSPFLRARRTAEIVREILGAESIVLAEGVRERFFGEFDLYPTRGVAKSVYELDKVDPEHTHYGVESVAQVLDRTTQAIVYADMVWQDTTILWVSHLFPIEIVRARRDLTSYLDGDWATNARVFPIS